MKKNIDLYILSSLLAVVLSACNDITSMTTTPSPSPSVNSVAVTQTPSNAPSPTAMTLQMTIVNGSEMPISPSAVYVTNNQQSVTEIGAPASPGLVTLCTMGNPSTLLSELSTKLSVTWSNSATNGLLFPGQSQTFEIKLDNVLMDSIHFVAMYGLSKDACATIDLTSTQLASLTQSPTPNTAQLRGVDQAISTGMFSDPAVGSATSCPSGTTSVIDCLRSLTNPVPNGTIRFFTPYLSTVISFLEAQYPASLQIGAPTTQNLLFRNGAVFYSIQIAN